MKDIDDNERCKEVFNSPLLERKRDRSFKYDVIFDLTINHSVHEKAIEDCRPHEECKTSCKEDSLLNSGEQKQSRSNASQSRTRGNSETCAGGLNDFAHSRPFFSAEDSKIQTKQTTEAAIDDFRRAFSGVEELKENGGLQIKGKFDIDRKRTFSLDGNRSQLKAKWNEQIGELCSKKGDSCTRKSSKYEKVLTMDMNSNKRRCSGAAAVKRTKKPRNIEKKIYIRSKSSIYMDDIGSDMTCSALRRGEGRLENETEAKIGESKADCQKGTHKLDPNQKPSESVSKRHDKITMNSFSIKRLSPKVQMKVIEKARKSSSNNLNRMVSKGEAEESKGVMNFQFS